MSKPTQDPPKNLEATSLLCSSWINAESDKRAYEFSGVSVWEGAEENEHTCWEGVKSQLDTAQEVQNRIHIKAKVLG
ncbi:hypothetical protein Tco_0266377 [Tanacetum coccineum]